MKEIASLFVSLFQDLKLPVRWVALISLCVLILVAIFSYEQLTGYFYLNKLERKITLLKELQSIANAGPEKHPELQSVYKRTVSELTNFEIRPVSSYIPSIKIVDSISLGKAISGALIWIIIFIYGVSSETRKDGKVTGMTIAVGFILLLLAVLFAWIGTLIPTLWNPWVNYILFPVLQLGILFLMFGRTKQPI